MREDCPKQNESCPLYPNCFSDEHHIYWPKRLYRTIIERAFKELPENKYQICVREHQLIHLTQLPPEKPSQEYMERLVDENKAA